MMKVGDLVQDCDGAQALVLTEPRLSEDCMPGGDGWPNETYYTVDVLVTETGCQDSWCTDEMEIVNACR
tara:strand:+ start:2390 stop:2596 length:207 start_codon:yes stop_codon:yes gene_type:complete